MSDHENCDHDHDEWEAVPGGDFHGVSPTYTLKALDFIGLTLRGAEMIIGGVANGVCITLRSFASEFFAAAAGRRERDFQNEERARLQAYADSFNTEELG